MSFDIIQQSWPKPGSPKPIVIIGAGGIVRDAHIPAYGKAGLDIAGVFDIDTEAARRTSEIADGVPVIETLAQCAAIDDVVFDLATPPGAHPEILRQLPAGAAVLMQKPMGANLEQALEILNICRERRHVAAVNFQLRFAPMIIALKNIIDGDMIGTVTDVSVNVAVHTPWELFPFLEALDRVEIAVHSIHYLDLLRHFLGKPDGVYARSTAHPDSRLAQTRTSAILNYGETVRCSLAVNHHHNFGPDFEAADIKVEGLKGAAIAQIGVLRDYPNGMNDVLKLNLGDGWKDVPLCGNWFIDAFTGPMANLQRVIAEEDDHLVSGVEDSIATMALVEAAYRSSESGGEPIPSLDTGVT